MEVVLNEPGSWFLLKKEDAHYIDVYCEASFVGFSLMIELNAEERREYHAQGKAFLQAFTDKISHYSKDYQVRNVTGPLQNEAYEAIMRLPHNTPRPPDGFITLPL